MPRQTTTGSNVSFTTFTVQLCFSVRGLLYPGSASAWVARSCPGVISILLAVFFAPQNKRLHSLCPVRTDAYLGRAEKGFESWTLGHTGRFPVQSMTFTLSGRDQGSLCVPGNTPSYTPEGSFHQRDCVPLGYFCNAWPRLYCLYLTHFLWFTKKFLWGLISVAVLVVIVWFRLLIAQSILILSIWFKKLIKLGCLSCREG